MAANHGPQYSKPIFVCENIQNGDPGDNSNLLATRGMGDVAGFQRRLFPHTSTHPVPKVPPVSLPKPVVPISGPSLWPLNSFYGVNLNGQRGQVDGSVSGYKDPPVPRCPFGLSPHQRILPPGHPIPPHPLPGNGLDSEPPQIRVGTQTGVRFYGLPVQPLTQTETDPEPLGVNSAESGIYFVRFDLPSQEVHVPDRPPNSNGKTGAPGQTLYETHSVAPQETLEGSQIPGKGDTNSKDSSHAPSMVDQGDKCLTRSTSAPSASCSSNLYRCLKRRLGCSLR